MQTSHKGADHWKTMLTECRLGSIYQLLDIITDSAIREYVHESFCAPLDGPAMES